MLRFIGIIAISMLCCSDVFSQDTGTINFTGFVTRSDNENVYLLWEVPDSSNFEYFIAEKSNNGVRWETLDTILHNGDSYLYTDKSPSTGLNYYRIKATANGKIFYSISRRAYVTKIDNSIPIYPNPVNKNLSFQMTALSKGRYQAVVYASNGVKIAGQVINHDGKDNYVTIALPAMISKGVYQLVLLTKNEFYKQNFLVQ
ncbi:MAG: type sorting protein [Chitinophagaceae bacterium]|nr:type sorting protein [Chitinophagaceae bacterium]